MTKKILGFLLKKPILTLIIFGILIRLLVVYCYPHITIHGDTESYLDLAELLSRLNLTGYQGYRSPGYPLLLLFSSLSITILLQFIFGIATIIIAYKNMLLLKFEANKAFFTALFLSTLLNLIFYELAILTESLTLLLITIIAHIYLKNFDQKISIKTVVYLNVLFAFLILVKPFYFFLPFVFYGFSILKNASFKNVFNRSLLTLIGPIICFFGWSYVNKINTGYFVPTTYYGVNLFQNCVYFAEKSPEKYHEIRDIYLKYRDIAIRENKDVSMSVWDAYDELIVTTNYSFIDLSYQLNEFSKETIKQNPFDYIRQVLLFSWMDFWQTSIFWEKEGFKSPYSYAGIRFVWYIQSVILVYFKIAFVLLFPIQLYRSISSKKITADFALSSLIIITSLAQAIVAYGTNSRYSYPFEFLIIILVISFISRFKYREI